MAATQGPNPNDFTIPYAITKTVHRDPYYAIDPTNPANNQKGKIIIITGASGGLGSAAAKVWATAHASGIVLAARRVEKLNALAAELQPLSPETKFLTVKLDLTVEDDVKNLYVAVQKEFGRPADVLLNNAGYLEDEQLIGDLGPDDWFKGFEINVKGLYSMLHHFIRSSPNPSAPTGTIVTVSSGRAGLTMPTGTAYDISKLAEQRLVEHATLEYPTLRLFTTMPGIAPTDMVTDFFQPYAKDHVDLTGMLALYLAQERADYLKGGMVGVNWDVDELEGFKERIVKERLLRTSWLPVLPAEGGKGLDGGAKVVFMDGGKIAV